VGWIFAVLGVGAIGFGLKAGRALQVGVVSERV
jgi:CP family cyanate transporter-like MFS transporter